MLPLVKGNFEQFEQFQMCHLSYKLLVLIDAKEN